MESINIAGTEIKEVQQIMFDTLIKVDQIARKYNIKYVLDWGTLLGCIRHHGFIPWDDDLDIALLRKDYNKLRKACMRDLDPNLFWQDNKSEKKYHLDFAKVKNINTIYVEQTFASLNINQGIFIDIFPMDNTFPKFHRLHSLVVGALQRLRFEKLGLIIEKNDWYEKYLKMPIIKILLWVVPLPLLNFLINICIQVFNIFPTNYVIDVCGSGTKMFVYNRRDFCDVIEGDFENHKFFIPKEFHQHLTIQYGDYMRLPPIDQRKPIHNIIKCDIHQGIIL